MARTARRPLRPRRKSKPWAVPAWVRAEHRLHCADTLRVAFDVVQEGLAAAQSLEEVARVARVAAKFACRLLSRCPALAPTIVATLEAVGEHARRCRAVVHREVPPPRPKVVQLRRPPRGGAA